MADTWSILTSLGGGGTSNQVLAYDAANNLLVGFDQSGYSAEVWQGAVSAGATGLPVSACDLNADGVVNSLDVQIAINQALGLLPCGNSALVGNGVCNAIDVQRVINASLGGTCLTGQ